MNHEEAKIWNKILKPSLADGNLLRRTDLPAKACPGSRGTLVLGLEPYGNYDRHDEYGIGTSGFSFLRSVFPYTILVGPIHEYHVSKYKGLSELCPFCISTHENGIVLGACVASPVISIVSADTVTDIVEKLHAKISFYSVEADIIGIENVLNQYDAAMKI